MDLFLVYIEILLGSEGFSVFLGFCREGNILLLSAHHLVMDAPFFLDLIMLMYFKIGMLFSSIYRSKKGLP